MLWNTPSYAADHDTPTQKIFIDVNQRSQKAKQKGPRSGSGHELTLTLAPHKIHFWASTLENTTIYYEINITFLLLRIEWKIFQRVPQEKLGKRRGVYLFLREEKDSEITTGKMVRLEQSSFGVYLDGKICSIYEIKFAHYLWEMVFFDIVRVVSLPWIFNFQTYLTCYW